MGHNTTSRDLGRASGGLVGPATLGQSPVYGQSVRLDPNLIRLVTTPPPSVDVAAFGEREWL